MLTYVCTGTDPRSNGRCTFAYESSVGDAARTIPPGTDFSRLPIGWTCPVCGTAKMEFKPISHFVHTARRCYLDAQHLERLAANQRPASVHNADQLYGLAVESALKAILLGLWRQPYRGGHIARDRSIPMSHMPEFWQTWRTLVRELHASAQGRLANEYNTAMQPLADPFADWDVALRYVHDDFIPNLSRHMNGAHVVMGLLDKAQRTDKIVSS